MKVHPHMHEDTWQGTLSVSEYPLLRYARRGEPVLDIRTSNNRPLHHAAQYPVFNGTYPDIPVVRHHEQP